MMRVVRNFRAVTGVLLGAAMLILAMPAAAAPLGQAGTGTVTGQVLSVDNVPLPNVRLAAFAQAPGTPNRTMLGEVQSDAQGRYSVQVPAGQVWMEFETQDINGQSFWGYDNNPVSVAAGQTVSSQDFRVAIRAVSAPTAVPQTAPPPVAPAPPPVDVTPPGMPTTGAGPDLRLPFAAALGMVLILLGMAERRRAPR